MTVPVYRGERPCPRSRTNNTMGPVQRLVMWCLVVLPLIAYVQVHGIKSMGRIASSELKPEPEVFVPFGDKKKHRDKKNKSISSSSTPSVSRSSSSSGASKPRSSSFSSGITSTSTGTTTTSTALVKTTSKLSQFNAECFLMDYGERPKKASRREKLDKLTLGRCRHLYPTRVPPAAGYTGDIDFFHLRDTHGERDQCFLYCIDQLDANEINAELLVQATKMGLTKVVKKLKKTYGVDPLESPSLGPDYDNKPGFNAVQEAIRGGHYEALKILTNSKTDLVIDRLGRTVADYLRMRGSPIRPKDAMEYLNLDTTEEQKGATGTVDRGPDMGWSMKSDIPVDERCDIDVIHGDMSRATFYNDYFTPGRPFVLRGSTPKSEIRAFSKRRWSTTESFHPGVSVHVGPTAYPSMTNQKYCQEDLTIAQIENATECPEMPGVPMVHARHPSDADLKQLYPMYDGDLYDRKGGWRKVEQFFGWEPWEYNLGWQVFFGGDGSGATFHWHNAAFNILYSGIKQWKVTPPRYRGFTGMPAKAATEQLDDAVALRCTQRPGDIMFIPDYWGHLTLNTGFAIGAAVILPDDYQMTADAKPKILFVHINKNGGTSLIRMLQERCESQYTSERWGKGHRTFHATAHSLIDHYGRDTWDDAYTFVVVRHPLARQVSNFFFLVDRCSRKYSELCEGRMIPKGLDLKTDEDKIEAFHEYTWNLYNEYPPGSKKHYLFGGWGHGNEEFKTMNATQTSWMVDSKGKMAVKNIFKLENLSRDMGELGESMPCLKNKMASKAESRGLREKFEDLNDEDEEPLEMVHANASPKYPDYRLFGKNKRTNRIMKEVYAVDYENFGYEF